MKHQEAYQLPVGRDTGSDYRGILTIGKNLVGIFYLQVRNTN